MFEEMKTKDIFAQAQTHAFEYADKALERNVFPTREAIEKLARFDEDLPEAGSDAIDIVQTLHDYGSPATVAQTGGRYFGFVNGAVVPAGLAARWLADFWDQNSALGLMSPITSKLEEVCEGWLKQLLGLPDRVVAGFVSGTSMAIFCGLAAGRYRLLQNAGWDVNKKGLNGAPKTRVVTSKQCHATVLKAVALLGLGLDNVELVEADEQGRIIAGQLPPLDNRTLLILQAGNVNSGSFDALDPVCDLASQAGAWVHIDGAFGLWAAASKGLQHLTRGIEKANAWSLDAHKTLNTPYDNGIVLCDDKDALVSALQATGSYILYTDKREGMHYTPEMSRRARVIELWATLKYLGRAGVDGLVYGLHERAVQMSQELAEAGFEVMNDVVFNQVLVACETDAITHATVAGVQSSGECWVGGAVWQQRPVIRVSVCSWATTPDDVTRSVAAFVDARTAARRTR
jgi:glutamate/tyrosine decarboxylase-like PLP-dependent enzyme